MRRFQPAGRPAQGGRHQTRVNQVPRAATGLRRPSARAGCAAARAKAGAPRPSSLAPRRRRPAASIRRDVLRPGEARGSCSRGNPKGSGHPGHRSGRSRCTRPRRWEWRRPSPGRLPGGRNRRLPSLVECSSCRLVLNMCRRTWPPGASRASGQSSWSAHARAGLRRHGPTAARRSSGTCSIGAPRSSHSSVSPPARPSVTSSAPRALAPAQHEAVRGFAET